MVTPRVDSTSSAARSAIEEMLAIAVANGAELHPLLEVRERDGQMSLHADAAEGETLIRLPEELLAPVDGVVWDASDDRLTIVEHDPAATAVQRELAELHVALYNATGKIRWARSTLPAVALYNDPAAVAAVRLLRPAFARQEQPIAEAFITTRVYRDGAGADQAPSEPVASGRRFLMPVIDLLNHHAQGAPFRVADGAMTIVVECPGADTQCFVRYRSRCDPLQMALGHGFVDSASQFARSAPLSLELAGLGTVEVAGTHPTTRSSLDPPRVTMEPGRLWLSHVIFPARHPVRMVGVLQLAVAAYLATHADAAPDPSAATSELVTALAEANLDRLSDARPALAGSTVDAAQVVVGAIDAQRLIIERVVRHLSVGRASVPDRRNRSGVR
jgi:hypothetical protein